MAWAEPKIYAYTWTSGLPEPDSDPRWHIELQRYSYDDKTPDRWGLGIWFEDDPGPFDDRTFDHPADAAFAVLHRKTGDDRWDKREARPHEEPPDDLDKWGKEFTPCPDEDEEED